MYGTEKRSKQYEGAIPTLDDLLDGILLLVLVLHVGGRLVLLLGVQRLRLAARQRPRLHVLLLVR
jgi:hypothetical protein